jgi:hypothetical protein
MALSPLTKEEFLNIFGSIQEAAVKLDCSRQRLYLRFRGDMLDEDFSNYIVGYCISRGIGFKLPTRFSQKLRPLCSNESSGDAQIVNAL